MHLHRCWQVVVDSARAALKWLGEKHLLQWSKEAQAFEPTLLGKACLASGLDPEEAWLVHEVIPPQQPLLTCC